MNTEEYRTRALILNPAVKHLLQTPTFLFTLLGAIATALSFHRVKYMDSVAPTMLMLAGGGVAIALWSETQRKNQRWGWAGLARALAPPSRTFWLGFIGHLPQLLAAVFLLHLWRTNGDTDNN